jgi:hypothetical protein
LDARTDDGEAQEKRGNAESRRAPGVKQGWFRFKAMTEMTTAVVISLPNHVPETNHATLIAALAALENSR